MEGEPVTAKISTPSPTPILSSMKRSQLQRLCKKYGLKANGKNTDLQIKLQQYATNTGEIIDMEDIEMYNPDIDKSSQRNQCANSISEPTTPSAIPLEQQNKVRRSLVDDSPIKMEIEIRENKTIEISSESLEGNMSKSKEDEMEDVNIMNVDHITNNQFTDHLVSDDKAELNPKFLKPAFEQVEMNDNMIESNENEMKDTNVTNVVHITNNQITDHLVSDEKVDLNPISVSEQVEMNDDMTESKENVMKDMNVTNVGHITNNQITDRWISDEKADLNPISAFEQVEMNDDMTESKENVMKDMNVTNVGHVTNIQITDHLISDEKADLNPISAFKQVEMNDDMTESKENVMKDVNVTNVDHITNNQITDHLVSDGETDLNPISLKSAFEQVEMNENITESKENEMKDVNVTNVDHITNNQITDPLFSDEKADLNPISLKPSFEQVEMNNESKEDEMKDVNITNVDHIMNNQITGHLVSDERTEQVEINDIPLSKKDIIDSVHKELETRFAILKALPSPERKKILENSKIPTTTPLRRNSEVSMIKQIGSSSANRFAKAHEKAFLQMPSIVTHYAVHKPKKVEENQDEINKKRKDLDSTQPLIKKQKLAHNTQENQVIKSTKDVYKKDEVVKSVVKRASRSSIRPKNILPNPEEQKKKEREEFEKRKQAARNVAQPVLEKMKNRKKSKENAEQKQSTKTINKSILPRRVQQ